MNHFWNQRAVDGLFQNLAAGSFRPASMLEVGWFVGLVVIVTVAVWWSGRVIRHRSLGRRREISRVLTGGAMRQLGLAPSDIRLAEALAETLREPEHNGHNVLLRESVFRATRRALLLEKPRAAFALTAFSARLGFPPRRAGLLLENSAEIPPGSLLRSTDGHGFRVVRTEPAGIWVAPLSPTPPPGRVFSVELHRPEGLYRLSTTIKQSDQALCLLQHCPRLERQQRRRHFRYAIRYPIVIDGRPAQTRDLSAGGVCLSGGRGGYETGQSVRLQFPGWLPDDVGLSAVIVAFEKDNTRLAFGPGQTGRCDLLLRHCIRAVRARDAEAGAPVEPEAEARPAAFA